MTAIKICGLRRECDIDFVNEAMPEYIGFVFAKSKRQVDARVAKKLKDRLHPDIKAVGVFVDEEAERIADLCKRGIIDMIQLHGKEDENYIGRLRTMTEAPIIKAVRAGQMTAQESHGISADYYLIDSGKGSGKTFDWSQVPEEIRVPWFLAGGLSTENIEEAIRKLHPYGVDFSSSVEVDGYKDRDKILDIVRRIRNVKR